MNLEYAMQDVCSEKNIDAILSASEEGPGDCACSFRERGQAIAHASGILRNEDSWGWSQS